jgi:hypothetical protein
MESSSGGWSRDLNVRRFVLSLGLVFAGVLGLTLEPLRADARATCKPRSRGQTGVGALDVNGHYVAYKTYACCAAGTRLCRGDPRAKRAHWPRAKAPDPEGQSFAPQVLVFADGGVAWTA